MKKIMQNLKVKISFLFSRFKRCTRGCSLLSKRFYRHKVGIYIILYALFLSIAYVFIMWYDFLTLNEIIPSEIDKADWISRAGALITISALFIHMAAMDEHTRKSKRGRIIGYDPKKDLVEKRYKNNQRASIVLTVLGTILWAYGDILYKIVLNN